MVHSTTDRRCLAGAIQSTLYIIQIAPLIRRLSAYPSALNATIDNAPSPYSNRILFQQSRRALRLDETRRKHLQPRKAGDDENNDYACIVRTFSTGSGGRNEGWKVNELTPSFSLLRRTGLPATFHVDIHSRNGHWWTLQENHHAICWAGYSQMLKAAAAQFCCGEKPGERPTTQRSGRINIEVLKTELSWKTFPKQ